MATSNVTSSKDLPTLAKGDKSNAVRFLEQILIGLGYPAKFDREYFNDEVSAVMDFQTDYNKAHPGSKISVDGKVGADTWKALGDTIYSRLKPQP